ncbi:MAG TPA: hypothetical protein PKY82_22635 [Pyrinomonadaceae bacterium]|nr:hypothetical protein [Pyrinomonadaceae bacterium]
MIYIKVGDNNVEFRFDIYAEPLNNRWATWSLSDNDKKFMKITDHLSKHKLKKMTNASEFFIARLNERAMKEHVDACKDPTKEGLDKSVVFKGTTFGRNYNIFSAYAALLKVGLPEGTTVKSHVFHTWDRRAFEKYIVKVTQAVGC